MFLRAHGTVAVKGGSSSSTGSSWPTGKRSTDKLQPKASLAESNGLADDRADQRRVDERAAQRSTTRCPALIVALHA
jgi:hypothetical protein